MLIETTQKMAILPATTHCRNMTLAVKQYGARQGILYGAVHLQGVAFHLPWMPNGLSTLVRPSTNTLLFDSPF